MLRGGSVEERAAATIGGSMDQDDTELEACRGRARPRAGRCSTNAQVDASPTPTDRGATKDHDRTAKDHDRTAKRQRRERRRASALLSLHVWRLAA